MTIIFDIFPSHGHQHASYKLAEILKESGHKIVYIGEYKYFKSLPPEFSRRYINPHIFNFIEKDTTNIFNNLFFNFFLPELLCISIYKTHYV